MNSHNHTTGIENRIFVEFRFPIVLLVLFLLSPGLLKCSCSQLHAEKPGTPALTPAQEKYFESKIRPVLVKECYACHSSKAEELEGGLSVENRASLLKGGDNGAAIVPGKPEESLLIEALKYGEDSFQMPPDEKLDSSVISDFVAWVKMGAPDPRGGQAIRSESSVDLDQGRNFWSFQSPVKHPSPKVKHQQWSRTLVDDFILHKVESAGLHPTKPARKETLIRRLSFDLTGLPPTPEEITQFVNDSSSDAYEKLVDRLLASHHFGERWGRHWLDVVRYAESSGGGRTLIFPEAWRYRDYVIQSFNDDKPFDVMIREQIAGDLLPYQSVKEGQEQLTATGMLVLGPTNYELQDKELLRMEVIDEQIDVLGRAFLGMSLGCARCHDHKFDPISTHDYYALVGIFRSTKTLTPGNVSGYVKQRLPLPKDESKAYDEYEAQLQRIDDQLKQLKLAEQKLTGKGKGTNKAVVINASNLQGLVVDETDAERTGTWTESSSVKPYVGSSYHHTSDEQSRMNYKFRIEQKGKYEVRFSYSANSNRASNAPVALKVGDSTQTFLINQRNRPNLDGVFHRLGEIVVTDPTEVFVTIGGKKANGVVIADAVQLIPLKLKLSLKTVSSNTKPKAKPNGNVPGGSANDSNQISEAENKLALKKKQQLQELAQQISQLEKQKQQLKKQAPSSPPMVMSVHDEDKTEDYFICIRGNVHKLGEKVARGFPQVMSSQRKSASVSFQGSGRMELAEWLTSSKHPLTSRVITNRVWHWLFGRGLVRTVDNFGTTGELPSHPELLDRLAVELQQHHWSLKWLIREIVLSSTYRMSSGAPALNRKKDPENRLLSYRETRRLDAESIRDAILSVSHNLDKTAGGPSTSKKVSSSFGYQFTSVRRSIYVPVFRNTLHELLEVFDFANPNIVTGQRTSSTLPTQALYLMNSPFVMDQSLKTAQHLLSNPSYSTDGTRLNQLYLMILGRSPREQELQLSKAYLSSLKNTGDIPTDEKMKGENKTEAKWGRLVQTLFSSIDFRYLQ